MRKRLLITGFFLSLFLKIHAQQTSFTVTPNYLPDSYYAMVDRDLPVYNGRLFQGYAPSIIGTPFLDTLKWKPGVVFYDSIWYKNLKVDYDANAGELLTETKSKMPVTLTNEKLSAFIIGDRRFIKLTPEQDKQLKEGFYEVVTEGKASFLALRKKFINESIEANENSMKREFLWQNAYYVYTQTGFHAISSKKDIYQALNLRKAIIKRSWREQNIKFKTHTESAIKLAVESYNEQ